MIAALEALYSVREDAEKALCAAVLREEMEQRLAAVLVIRESWWYSPSIAKALMEAWKRYSLDANSFSTRRFAITSLSYLRSVTPAVVPALLATCQDIWVVRNDAIAAAGRFQRIEGDILPDLIATLTGESVRTAGAVAQLLGALGASSAGEEAGLRDDIITALVEAIYDPRSHRTFEERRIETVALTEKFYAELLRVAGWPS